MDPIVSAIKNTVSISQFNRGLAGRIFDEVKRSGAKVVIKNNAAEVVLVPPDEYIHDKEELENLRLYHRKKLTVNLDLQKKTCWILMRSNLNDLVCKIPSRSTSRT